MISRLIKGLALCAAFFGTVVDASDSVIPASSSKPFVLPSGSVPETIFGNSCLKKDGDANFAPSLDCKGQDVVKNPHITVSVIDSSCSQNSKQMMEARRNWLNDGTPFFKVVWEREFLLPTVPDGVGYKGFYQKSIGNRYWWETCGQGRLTRVSVIMFGPTDNEALKDEIEEKVFGITNVTATMQPREVTQ